MEMARRWNVSFPKKNEIFPLSLFYRSFLHFQISGHNPYRIVHNFVTEYAVDIKRRSETKHNDSVNLSDNPTVKKLTLMLTLKTLTVKS